MKLDLHEWQTVERSNGQAIMQRCAVPSGWLYTYAHCAPVYVPDPTAPHCRSKVRRLKPKDETHTEWETDTILRYLVDGDDRVSEDRLAQSFTAYHPDGSETDHATRIEAHDALGPDSPWVEVTE